MPLITRENAAEYGRRGNAARWSRPRLTQHSPQITTGLDEYRATRLARVRQQLDLLDQMFQTECLKGSYDAAKLDRLASALNKLSEQERLLANRPAPSPAKVRDERSRTPIVYELDKPDDRP